MNENERARNCYQNIRSLFHRFIIICKILFYYTLICLFCFCFLFKVVLLLFGFDVNVCECSGFDLFFYQILWLFLLQLDKRVLVVL